MGAAKDYWTPPTSPPPAETGRPQIYNEDLGTELCRRMTDRSKELPEGRSLVAVCRDQDMPSVYTVMLWFGRHPEFSQRYANARATRADYMFEEMLKIADDGSRDYDLDPEKGVVANWDHIQRARLRVETRKWALARMDPRRYGERTILAGDAEAPLAIGPSSPELEARRKLVYDKMEQILDAKLAETAANHAKLTIEGRKLPVPGALTNGGGKR